jgi:hypothetical protein
MKDKQEVMPESVEKAVKTATELIEKAESLYSGINEAAGLLEKTVSTTTSSSFAQREHLDRQIADITNRKTPFLDMVTVKPTNGLTHEWDMIVALGNNDTATEECGTPPDNELTIQRYSAQVKTFATKVKVCDRAQWAASDYFNLMNTHLEGGMRKVIQDVEKKCFYGDASSNVKEFNGLYKLIDSYAPEANMINAEGNEVDTNYIDAAIQAIIDQGGTPTHIWMGAKDLKDFAAEWANKVVYNDPGAGMTFGYNVARYMSFAGPLTIVLDNFITGTVSPNTPNTDVFVLTMDEIALAQSEPMYRLPVYRGLDLAETQAVVWNCVLEVRIPQWQAVVKNIG